MRGNEGTITLELHNRTKKKKKKNQRISDTHIETKRYEKNQNFEKKKMVSNEQEEGKENFHYHI